MAIQSVTAVINGQTVTLEYNSSTGKYEKQLTAPLGSSNSVAEGFYGVSVTATDTASNTVTITPSDATYGNKLKLYVKEQVAPTVSISSPSAGAYITSATPTLTFTARDNSSQASGYSGFDPSDNNVISITLDGNTYNKSTMGNILKTADMTWTNSAPNYTGSNLYGQIYVSVPFLHLSDGSHTVSITFKDKDGNISTAVSRTFTVDTVAPALDDIAINGFTDSTVVTNINPLTITGTTDDTSATISITLDGVDQGSVTIAQDGSFSKQITLSADGTYAIIISAVDAAGNATPPVSIQVTLDTYTPVFTNVILTKVSDGSEIGSANPAEAGATYKISVTLNDVRPS